MENLSIGEKIRMVRKEFNLSQKDFSERLGIKPPYLSEIENSKKEITTKILIKLKEQFGISADWIMYEYSSTPVFTKYISEKKELNQNENNNIEDADLKLLNKHFKDVDLDDVFLYIKKHTANNLKQLSELERISLEDKVKARIQISDIAKMFGFIEDEYYKSKMFFCSFKEYFEDYNEELDEANMLDKFKNPKLKWIVTLIKYENDIKHLSDTMDNTIYYLKNGCKEYLDNIGFQNKLQKLKKSQKG